MSSADVDAAKVLCLAPSAAARRQRSAPSVPPAQRHGGAAAGAARRRGARQHLRRSPANALHLHLRLPGAWRCSHHRAAGHRCHLRGRDEEDGDRKQRGGPPDANGH